MDRYNPFTFFKRLYNSPWHWVLLGLLAYWSSSYLFFSLTEWVRSRARTGSPSMAECVFQFVRKPAMADLLK